MQEHNQTAKTRAKPVAVLTHVARCCRKPLTAPQAEAPTSKDAQACPDLLVKLVSQQLQTERLGLQNPAGFMPVPVSLTPWQLTSAQFSEVQQLAQLLGQIQAQAAAKTPWLLTLLAGLRDSPTVPGHIWRTLHTLQAQCPDRRSEHVRGQRRNLLLNRHDFLLDQHQQWRWVESNPIAAGMGPLNSRYLRLLQHHWPHNQPPSFARNDAIRSQAALLAGAAISMAFSPKAAERRQPLMLIVVEADEDNIFDQQLLCDEVQRLGVQVQRVTIRQLLQGTFDQHNQLCWQAQQVDLLYWRTGYNPAAELDEAFWQFRAKLEQAQVVQCPTLAGQLTGSKWFQHQFSALLLASPQTVAAQFGLSDTAIAMLQQAVQPSFAVRELTPAQAQQLIAQGYWYKTQQEGGGNVARGPAAAEQLAQADVADLLMAPIDAAIRQEALQIVRHGQASRASGHITELGIFTLGEQARYGGYLCRTKPAQHNEGGIHRGGAVLDTILLR